MGFNVSVFDYIRQVGRATLLLLVVSWRWSSDIVKAR